MEGSQLRPRVVGGLFTARRGGWVRNDTRHKKPPLPAGLEDRVQCMPLGYVCCSRAWLTFR